MRAWKEFVFGRAGGDIIGRSASRSGTGQPVLEVFGQDGWVAGRDDMAGDIGGNIESAEVFLNAQPQPVAFFVGIGKVKLGDKLLQLCQCDGVEVLIIAGDDFFLVGGVVSFRHSG